MSNFTNDKTKNIAILLLLILNIGLLVALWLPRKMGPPPLRQPENRAKRINQFFQDELDLNEEQAAKFLASSLAHHKRVRNSKEATRSSRKKFMETMILDDPFASKLDSMVEEIVVHHRAFEASIKQNYQELWNICTPDQREKLSVIFRETLRPPRPRPGRERR